LSFLCLHFFGGIPETRISKPAKPGQVERYDYEYKRNGVRNMHVALVDEVHPEAEVIQLILDNLKTHKPAALYSTFPPVKALRILKKLEFHYTPKHASWLNMAEIELSVFDRRLKAFIPDDDGLFIKVNALVNLRNHSNATVDWQFHTEDARIKLKSLYPSIPD
jgi:hypothetical protein